MPFESAFLDELRKLGFKAPPGLELSLGPSRRGLSPGAGKLTSPGWLLRHLGFKKSKLHYHDPVLDRVVTAVHKDPELLEKLRRELYSRESKLQHLSALMGHG
jgi:hypothetical protein